MELLDNPTTLERMILERAKRARTPANGSIELLPLCNMNCDMCYVRLSRREMEAQGRLRAPEEWLEVGRQMKEAGVLFLLLTGGEPFLYPEFRKVYLGLRQMGMILTINTNGTLIDEDLAAFFGKYKPRRVNITLYGADDGAYERLCHYPGGYAKTLRGIRLLRGQGGGCEGGGKPYPGQPKGSGPAPGSGAGAGSAGAGGHLHAACGQGAVPSLRPAVPPGAGGSGRSQNPCPEAGDGAGAVPPVCSSGGGAGGPPGAGEGSAGTDGLHGGTVFLYH